MDSESIAMFWRQVKYMCWKELLATLKDPRFRWVLILPAILMGFLFGYAANFNIENITYAVLDQSQSKASTTLLAALDGTSFYHRVATLQSSSQIQDPINDESAMMVIVIPEDFVSRLESGSNAPIQIITDGRNTMTASLSAEYTMRIVEQWMEDQSGMTSPISVDSRTWFNPNQITRWFFMPGILGIMSFIQVILLAGLSVAREREEGTFEQLLVTPSSPIVILIGKACPPILIGMLQATILLAISLFWFKVPFQGSFVSFYIALFVFFLSSTGVGLSISSFCKNMQQVQVYTMLYMVPMGILSGIATPIRNMPQFLQYLTYINPLRFALDAIRRIYLEGATLWQVSYNFIPMVIIAAITLCTAAYLFRHNL